ncbi:MAG: hypothetical protein PVH17_11900 [Anaerolineae bacterium]|jgi:hypothetical protein
MNILDENVLASQCHLLRGWRISFRQIGHEVGRQGMDDAEIIPLLHSLRQPTFFTLDDDFYERHLCHAGYCLVYLNVKRSEAAIFVRRLLRHPEFDTQAKRMGAVIRVSHVGLTLWRLHAEEETFIEWLD